MFDFVIDSNGQKIIAVVTLNYVYDPCISIHAFILIV